jgi:Na+-translocating ferredoxin:NAD+ oxidoreductase RnfC subunit
MACQTRVEDGMYLVQIPFTPAQKANYDITKEEYNVTVLLKHYPEVARCVACNTCSKACPQDLEVMDYIQDALRGDFSSVAERSFDCIMCGLCAIRCPAEITQFNVAQLARRMYGRYGMTEPEYAKRRLTEIEQGKFDKEFKKLLAADIEELKKRYAEREREPD